MEPDDIDNDQKPEPGSPELDLWIAALTLYLGDARRCYEGKTSWSAPAGPAREALQDILSEGPILRRLCGFAGVDPHWLYEKFMESLPEMANFGKTG
ncbi:hypothetical protein [Pseudomonas sp. OIL-1]|uniref:hypothetical protein n=1 Tax=Pseudomonas sp. OIL-1 TaxID=2706126 RepID=UPI0013A7290A|nr:hypothetical protein [Pseudomonas sp. OIL-1]QIB52131.1 hypothetical protein G3M63_14395 [Pseudomonas sp. OIL-1]